MRRKIVVFLTFLMFFSFSESSVFSQDSGKGSFISHIEKEFERIEQMDLYGSSAMLPEGVLTIKYEFTHLYANKRFDGNGNKVAAIPIVSFGDETKKYLALDLGLSGEGGSHLFQISYGITDPLDIYVELPFQYMTVKMNPRLDPIDDAGNVIDPMLGSLFKVKDTKGLTGEQFLCLLPETVGRPTPATYYHTDWAAGDINGGFSWNYYRTKRFSAALTSKLFFPTGDLADPNQSLIFATGPQLDVGNGGWAFGVTHTYDLRLFKPNDWFDLIGTFELYTSYGFPQERNYPTNFSKPNPVVMSLLDPAGIYFPDLSGLKEKGKYTYTPGFSTDSTFSLHASVAFMSLAVGYNIAYAQEPEIEGDQNFIAMVKGLELLGQSTIHTLEVGGGVALFPLYIPAVISVSYKKMFAGRNALIFDDFIKITIQAYAPLIF
jgi:hypothetical protein